MSLPRGSPIINTTWYDHPSRVFYPEQTSDLTRPLAVIDDQNNMKKRYPRGLAHVLSGCLAVSLPADPNPYIYYRPGGDSGGLTLVGVFW